MPFTTKPLAPASVSLEAGPDALERAKGSQVFFAGSDKPVEWDGAHSTLLELAEACGVPVSSGCRAGNCGACRMRVIGWINHSLEATRFTVR